MTDDLAPLLAPTPTSPSVNRDALLRATTRTLRRKAVVRRVVSVLGVIAVFGVGGAAGWVLKPTQEREVVTVTEIVTVAAVLPAPEPEPKAVPTESPLSATQLELRAELADEPADAAKLYRAAGDRFLTDLGDYDQAVRCYRLYFRHAGSDGAKASTDDSWLLLSLKSAKLKEKGHANLGS